MAIDNRLQIFDENDNPVDYDIMATDVKFADGKDLPTKLDELENEIGESQGGYTPPPGGIPKTDLSPAVQQTLDNVANKVDKVTGYGLSKNDYTDTDKAKVDGLKPVATSGSYNDLTDKPTIPTVPTMDATPTAGNTTHMVSSDGVAAAIAAAIAQAGGQVTVTTNGDGTFTIHSGENDYTINLNHTHEGMAKLVVDTAANLPDVSEMESDTIYGEVDDGEISVLYVGGIPFYGGGGGGTSTPVLRQPTDGSSFEMGGASRTIKVNGKNLTQALTIELTGTGYAFGNTQPSGVTIVSTTELTVSAAAANAVSGVDVVVEYSGSNPYASGTIGITSGSPDNISCEASLLYNDLVSANYIKFTGQQYLLTDYHPNPKTHLEMDMKFEDNGNFNKTTGIYRSWFGCNNNTVGAFKANFGSDVGQLENHECMYWMEKGYVSQTWVGVYPNNFYTRSTWTYNNNVVSFLGVNTPTETKTTTQDGNFEVGANDNLTSVFNAANILMYSIKIYEDDVLVREYLPKKSTSGNVYGMFETKTKQFITSGSSTGFEGA